MREEKMEKSGSLRGKERDRGDLKKFREVDRKQGWEYENYCRDFNPRTGRGRGGRRERGGESQTGWRTTVMQRRTNSKDGKLNIEGRILLNFIE